jgi:hypothetical protein
MKGIGYYLHSDVSILSLIKITGDISLLFWLLVFGGGSQIYIKSVQARP